MTFFPIFDLKVGRLFLYFAVTCHVFIMYLEPGFWHESIGHMTPIPKYDVITNYGGKGGPGGFRE